MFKKIFLHHPTRCVSLRFPAIVVFSLLACLLGCAPSAVKNVQPNAGEFSVMSYNLHGITNHKISPDNAPDILALQGVTEDSEVFTSLKKSLNYPFAKILITPESPYHLALFSRLPVRKYTAYTNLMYSIKSIELTVHRGIQKIEVETGSTNALIIYNTHFKSREYLPPGQNEMRRNEARLLRQLIGKIFKYKPSASVLVCGTLNDDPTSAPLEILKGTPPKVMHDLRPKDIHGACWTHHELGNDYYRRLDYLLASSAFFMRLNEEKILIPQGNATPYRPLYAVFKK